MKPAVSLAVQLLCSRRYLHRPHPPRARTWARAWKRTRPRWRSSRPRPLLGSSCCGGGAAAAAAGAAGAAAVSASCCCRRLSEGDIGAEVAAVAAAAGVGPFSLLRPDSRQPRLRLRSVR